MRCTFPCLNGHRLLIAYLYQLNLNKSRLLAEQARKTVRLLGAAYFLVCRSFGESEYEHYFVRVVFFHNCFAV